MRILSGETLRALIKQRGMNQSSLAAAAGCSASFINALCAGAKTSCSKTLASRVAVILQVPISVIFDPAESLVTGQSIQPEGMTA